MRSRVTDYFISISVICFLQAAGALSVQAESVKFGVFLAPPWGIEHEGEVSGITVDHIKVLTSAAGLDAQFRVVPYPRMIQQLDRGDIDCVIASQHPGSSNTVAHLSSLYPLNVSVISRKDKKFTTDQQLLSTPAKSVVGFSNGTGHFHSELFNSDKIILQLVKGHAKAPIMLSRHRVDAFVGIERLLLYELRKSDSLDSMYFPGYTVNQLQMWLQCSKKSKNFAVYAPKLLAAAKLLKENEVINDIVDQWIPKLTLDELEL